MLLFEFLSGSEMQGYYRIQFPPYEELGKNYLRYSTKEKKFELGRKQSATIFAWHYLFGDDYLKQKPDSILLSYLDGAEYRLIQTTKRSDIFGLNLYRGFI